jgi:hypothetical protein
MERKAKCIEVRNSDGKKILSLYLFVDEDMVLEDKPEVALVVESETKKEKDSNPQTKTDEPPMTSAQKRYLFRILAEKGIEGDEAHQQLKDLFQVNSLKEVTKFEASRMIERLLEENKGGNRDVGSPF